MRVIRGRFLSVPRSDDVFIQVLLKSWFLLSRARKQNAGRVETFLEQLCKPSDSLFLTILRGAHGHFLKHITRTTGGEFLNTWMTGIVVNQQLKRLCVCFSFFFFKFVFLKKFKFIYLPWERMRGTEKEEERESPAGSSLSGVTVRSWREPKSRAGCLTKWATQAPLFLILLRPFVGEPELMCDPQSSIWGVGEDSYGWGWHTQVGGSLGRGWKPWM